jgi:hypothetical protein
MHLISRLCGGVFCFTVAVCPSRDVSLGDVRSGYFLFNDQNLRAKNRKQERENRKEERGNRLSIFSFILKILLK